MKTKKIKKRFNLNKKTMAHLNHKELQGVRGGENPSYVWIISELPFSCRVDTCPRPETCICPETINCPIPTHDGC